MQLATDRPDTNNPEIALTGRFDAFETEGFRTTVDGLLGGSAKSLSIVMSDVVFVDSSGLAELVRAMKHCRERGGELNAITTARMHRAALDQAMVAKEHATAARITTAALPDPDQVPAIEGVSLFANLVPARNTGGDLYAWREINGSLWFALGDVSGKGLPAAVQMSTITSAIEAGFRQHHLDGPDAVVEAVGRWVHDRLSESGMFVTLAVGHWDPATCELRLANAGHSPIVFRRDGESERIDATAPPVGVIEGMPTIATVIETRPDDLLVLATDGFTEQDNPDGEMYGEDRFDDTIAVATGGAVAVGEHLLNELAEHGQDCEQSDDRTLMVLHFS
ncbi:Protein IcfG [Nymphon striatum]|nr:Protein IcfG [Nymphon striatum]